MPSRALLADVQLLGLLHLEHGRRRVRYVPSSGPCSTTTTTPSRRHSVTSGSVSSAAGTGSSVATVVVTPIPSTSRTRSGTPRWNVPGTVRAAVVGHSPAGGRSVRRVLLLLHGFAEAGSHLLATGDLRTARYPVELRLEIKVVLRGVEFLLDEVGPREGRHVTLVELVRVGATRGVGPHKVLAGAAELVAELVCVRGSLTLGTLRSSRWESYATHAAHGVLVLVLFGHVLQGLCRRGEFRHGAVLWVSVRTPFWAQTGIVERIRELRLLLLRYGTAPLDAHVVQHAADRTRVFLLDTGLLLHLDLLLGVQHLLLLLLVRSRNRWLLLKVQKVGMEVGQVGDEILEGVAFVVGVVPDEIGKAREVPVGGGVLLQRRRQVGKLVLRLLLKVHNVAKVVQVVWRGRRSAATASTPTTSTATMLLLLLLGRTGTLALDGRIREGFYGYVRADLLRLRVGRRRRKLQLLHDLDGELGKVFRSTASASTSAAAAVVRELDRRFVRVGRGIDVVCGSFQEFLLLERGREGERD